LARTTWVPRVLIVLVVIGLGWNLPTLFFDDAYITFRYAANLAAGDGFTYNPPEHVLGVTTPLLTLLLAAAAWLGADLESAALMLGLAGHALLCLAVLDAVPLLLAVRARPGPNFRAVGLFAALVVAFHPHLAFTAVGGMETSLYCALIISTLAASARSRTGLAGALFGVALLTRPDAVLIALPAALLLWGGDVEGGYAGLGRFGVIRATIAAAAVSGWWFLFAWSYFGSPVPHSILAKRLIHPVTPEQVVAEFTRYASDDIFMMVALPLALWTVLFSRRRMAKALGLFCLLYVGAIIFGGVEPFAWYINPVIPAVLALAMAGLADLLTLVRLPGKAAGWAALAVTALAVVPMCVAIKKQAPGLADDWDAWEGTYEVAARWIMSDSKPGDRIYVGETGVIGYLLGGRYIIDSSGINSPEVIRLRAGRREQDPEWSRRIIRELSPDYITTSVAYLNVTTIASEAWFDALYERVASPLVEQEGQVIFRRRRDA